MNPKFNGNSFWSYKSACVLIGASYPAPSLGLITVAAMLPAHWELRLLDRNVSDSEAELDSLLCWADMVLSTGMLPQQRDHFSIIDRAKALGIPTVVGGPHVSTSPELFARADFRVVGEAEGCMDDLIAAIERGDRSGQFEAPRASVDITQSPIPRFDLLDFSNYVQIAVQFSRGCPFRCEFCDIIELYGRKPRTKTNRQMIAELDRLYELGYRGAVELSDDNLIGNKKAVKSFLFDLIVWQKAHHYPFAFGTEASLNIADDLELLQLMREANFLALFIGIETPDADVLMMTQKNQNARRDIVESVHRIQAAGIFVIAGFIVGFDNEHDNVSEAMVDLIERAAIPIAMVGLLYALPNTQLTKRLAREGRLHARHNAAWEKGESDHCATGLNFETIRPRHEVLYDYREVVARIYSSDAYFGRVIRAIDLLDASGANGHVRWSPFGWEARILARFLWSVTFLHSPMRRPVWRVLWHVVRHNPRAIRAGIYMAALYAHLGPFSRFVVSEVDRRIVEDKAAALAPRPLPEPVQPVLAEANSA